MRLNRSILRAAVLAAAGLCVLAGPGSLAWAQSFEVPEGFISEPESGKPAEEGLRPLVTIRPAEGPFSELTGMSLSEVVSPVENPGAWLKKRVTIDLGGDTTTKDLFNSPDSPFDDPTFETLRKALPRLFEGLTRLGKLPLEFCEDPTTGYNAAGEFRELYCAFDAGPFRRFQVMRLQEVDGHWYYTEMHTMNERRLRHLLAIANSFNM